ncbi:MAG: fatty acid desaturase [Fibrobacteria bacterium]
MLDSIALPTRQTVREFLSRFRIPEPRLALTLLAVDLAVYLASWGAILSTGHLLWQAALAMVNGVAIARLFVLGHDACHGSSFRKSWANQLAGRVAFLPSLTPYSTWELGHNTLHHGFTNLRGKDYVYAPLSKAEYDGLRRWRRVLERAYRHPLGPGLYYLVEVWWKRLWFPRPGAVDVYHPRFFADSLGTAVFLAAQMAIAVAAAGRTGENAVVLILVAVVLPQAGWYALMGFVTYQHHTHPDVRWFDDRQQWDPLSAQVENTVHVEFPWLVGKLLGNIMEHTAHHVDVKIPLGRLPEAQKELESRFSSQVPVQAWSWKGYVENCRQCQLYDYEKGRWLGFDGK